MAQWETSQGTAGSGGMMVWNLSGGQPSQTYYDTIRTYLQTWAPPAETSGAKLASPGAPPRPQAQM